jgi:GxGYxYP putative glycoside hydrolase C-terminal domain/GxGYxYP_N second domain/GxGYxYP third domain/GxGYxYP_N 1st domain
MKITRRNFLGTTAGATAYAALSPHIAKGQTASSGQGLIWPPDQALPRFLPPEYLDAGNIASLTGDQQLLLTTLQGIVNRSQSRLYWFQGFDGTDQAWLQTFNIPNSVTSDPMSLIDKYRGEVKGAIIHDPNLPHTINVATSLAGIMDAVVASADLATQYNLPIVMDLRSRFASTLDAYNWVLENYWSQLTHRMLAGISPANASTAPGVQWTTLLKQATQVHNNSNKAVYTIDLSSFLSGGTVYVRFQDSFSNQGWGPSVQQVTVLADGNTIASFQPGTAAEQPFLYESDSSAVASGGWRFADATSYFIYRFTPPSGTTRLTMQVLMWNQYLVTATNQTPLVYSPNPRLRDYIVATGAFVFWLDPEVPSAEADLFTEILQKVAPDTPYLGWFVAGREAPGVTLLSQNSSYVAAADLLDNATVQGAIKAPVLPVQPAAVVPNLQNKIYVTLTISEGDNLQYCEHRLRQIWDDPNRGTVPLNWSLSPLLLDAAPGMVEYYQSTQSVNDFMVAGPSGAGYCYPSAWPAAEFPTFTERTGDYMQRLGMNVIFVLNHPIGGFQNLTDAAAADYAAGVNGLLGVLGDWTATSQLTTPSGVPVITEVSINNVAQGLTALNSAATKWNGTSPVFVALSAIAWNMTPTMVNRLVSLLGPQYEVVRADVFFKLLRQTLGSS